MGLESIKELDPALGLEFDEQRSRKNVSAREVRIVPASTRIVEDMADRAWELLGRVRKLEFRSLTNENPAAVSFNCLQAA